MISINNLSFSYDKNKEVLKNISLEINKGEIAVLLGPNGAGKTTLINCILGLLKVKNGDILIDEKSIKKINTKDKASLLSFVPQESKRTDLTVKETILLGRLHDFTLYPRKEDLEKVDEIIAQLGLEEIKDKTTYEISGGELQRVSIATALVQDSEVIIFDEPTSNLDIKSQKEILSIIKDASKNKGKTIILTMHDINQAISIGERFIFIKDNMLYRNCLKEDINITLLEEIYNTKIHKEGRIYYYEV